MADTCPWCSLPYAPTVFSTANPPRIDTGPHCYSNTGGRCSALPIYPLGEVLRLRSELEQANAYRDRSGRGWTSRSADAPRPRPPDNQAPDRRTRQEDA